MVKLFTTLLCALFLQSSIAKEVDNDWVITVHSHNVVAMYRHVTPVGAAQFNVDMLSIYRPGAAKLNETISAQRMQGVLAVNCLTRTTKVIRDQTFDQDGNRISVLDNNFAKKDTNTTPKRGTTQEIILSDVCGDHNIEWDRT